MVRGGALASHDQFHGSIARCCQSFRCLHVALLGSESYACPAPTRARWGAGFTRAVVIDIQRVCFVSAAPAALRRWPLASYRCRREHVSWETKKGKKYCLHSLLLQSHSNSSKSMPLCASPKRLPLASCLCCREHYFRLGRQCRAAPAHAGCCRAVPEHSRGCS